jgi:hypothetical protein
VLRPAAGEQPVDGAEHRRAGQQTDDRPVQTCCATCVDHEVHRHDSQKYAGGERHHAGDGRVLKRRVVPANGPDQQAGCRQGAPARRFQGADQPVRAFSRRGSRQLGRGTWQV